MSYLMKVATRVIMSRAWAKGVYETSRRIAMDQYGGIPGMSSL